MECMLSGIIGAKRCFLFLMVSCIIGQFGCQDAQPTGQYLNQTPPTVQPEVFAQGIISKDSVSEFGCVFSTDGYEVYFGVDLGDRSEIRSAQYIDGLWSVPQTIVGDKEFGFNDPFLSPDESELYYISNLPRNPSDTLADFDIWFSKRLGESWSPPINAGERINSDYDEYYVSFSDEKTIYFSSNRMRSEDLQNNFNVYRSEIQNGQFNQPLSLSDSINGRAYEADVYVAADESYVIFCSVRRGGLGRGDLYISRRRSDQTWSRPLNMGEIINSEGHELCPFVTRDGKYLFYTSHQDIYWVSFPNLLEAYIDQLM